MMFLLLIAAIAVALFVTWRIRFRYPPADAPRVLCYHKISDRFCVEGTWTTRRRFTRQIDDLLDRGYTFVGEDHYLLCLDAPGGDGKQVLLTFDDGYDDLFDVCREVLLPRRVPVLVFIVSDYAGRDNDWELSLGRRPFRHMDWDRLRELERLGVQFGSHGATHRDLTRLSPGDLAYEIEGSKARIEKETGAAPRCFSYPFGRSNAAVREAVERAGYEAAFSLYPPHSNERIDRYALRRNCVYVIDTPWTLGCKLSRNPLFWFEEMKCRTINQVAVLTPILKRAPAARDK